MAKLNKDDHKVNDKVAKVVKWGLRILGVAGAAFVGSKIKDINIGNDDDDDDDAEEV